MSCRHYYRLSRIFYCINHGINSLIKNSCSFLLTKKNQKITSFCQKEAKTTPFGIHCIILLGLSEFIKKLQLQKFVNFINNKGFQPLVLTAQRKAHNGLKPHCYSRFGIYFDFANSYAVKNIKSKNQFGIMSLSDYGSCYKNYSTERNENFRNNCDFKNHNSNFCFDGDKIYNLSRNLSGFLFNKKIFKKNKNQGEKK